MALLSDMVPIRGTEGLGKRGTGKGEGEQESRAKKKIKKKREWGQNEGRCVYVGED